MTILSNSSLEKRLRQNKFVLSKRIYRLVKDVRADLTFSLFKKKYSRSHQKSLKLFFRTAKFGLRKVSLFKRSLIEKRRLKIYYGFFKEKQLKRVIKRLSKSLFFHRIEFFIENFIQRLGFFRRSYFFARQFVIFGHVLVNSKLVLANRFQLKPGQIVSFTSKTTDYLYFWFQTVKNQTNPSAYFRNFFTQYVEFSPSLFCFVLVSYPIETSYHHSFRVGTDGLSFAFRQIR
jgi:ribosomal protein S4